MKPHPRIRKTIKWAGAAVTVLLVVVWVVSGWWKLSWMSPHGRAVGIGAGGVYCVISLTDVTMLDHQRGFRLDRKPRYTQSWDFNYRFSRGRDLVVARMHLWLPFGVSLAATALAWHLDTLARRRARIGFCPKCGYDRTGILKDAKCPECGAVPASV